jgi:hypothetical protein
VRKEEEESHIPIIYIYNKEMKEKTEQIASSSPSSSPTLHTAEREVPEREEELCARVSIVARGQQLEAFVQRTAFHEDRLVLILKISHKHGK